MTPRPFDAAALPGPEGVSWHVTFAWPAPPWAVLVTVIGLFALVAWLYAHEAVRVRTPARIAMAALRLSALAVLALMLSGISIARYRTGLPALAVVVDGSASMAIIDELAKQGDKAAKSTPNRLELVQRHLSADNAAALRSLQAGREVIAYSLADQASWLGAQSAKSRAALAEVQPLGAASRLGDGVQSVLDDLRGRAPTGIVLFTDGINTAGQPLAQAAQAARDRGVPLFLVGVGDEVPPRDVELAEVLADEIVFTGDIVNFQCELRNQGLEGQTVEVRLRPADSEEPLAQTKVTLDEPLQSVLLSYRSDKPGRHALVLEVVPVAGEENVENNRRNVEVDVRDDRVKVLYVQGPPSFEYRFLKALLERDERFELACVLQEADPEAAEQDRAMLSSFPLAREALGEFDVIIWGDVDPGRLPPGALEQVRELVVERGRGLVFSSGSRHTPLAYVGTPLEGLCPLTLSAALGTAPEDQQQAAAMVAGEQIASAPFLQLLAAGAAQQALQALPPVYWRIEGGSARPAARVYARFAAEGNAASAPAILGQYAGAGEVVLIGTDEIWRWRREQHEAEYDRFWVQLLRYLARAKLRAGQEGVELVTDKTRYGHQELVWLRARFRDPELSPASDELAVDVQLPDGRTEAASLKRRGSDRGAFGGALRFDVPGVYRARLRDSEESVAEFTIEAPPGEQDRKTADFQALTEAATISGGRFYRLSEADRLPQDLPRPPSAPIEALPATPLWNRWPLLLAFVTLLSAEWVLRKRQGLA